MERYSKIFPICSSYGEKKCQVKFSITTNSASSTNQKEIIMQLTKDENPLFFYNYRMTEEDFRNFKLQQDLKVDFANFPQMIIDLLESVLLDDSKFYLWFDENGYSTNEGVSNTRRNVGLLKIVQSAGHKDLTHLTLKFSPADSKQIQVYLADTIIHLKRRLSILEKQNRQSEIDHKRQCQNFEETLAKRNEDVEILKSEHAAALVELKDGKQKDLQEMRNALGRERTELNEKFESVQDENKFLKDQLRESCHGVESVRDEFQRLNDEVEQLRQRTEEYRREVIEMEKVRNDLQTRLESAEEDVESKEIELEETKDRYQALLDQKRKLEHSLHEWTSRSKKFEDLYNVQCGETEKAVQIMHKCVNYSNICKDKGAKAELIARKQQELLKNMESEISKVNLEKERSTKEIEALKEENQTLTTTTNDFRRQLQEQTNLLVEKQANSVGCLGTSAMKDFGPVLIDHRSNTFKTPPADVTFGKNNKTPFLHPKYSSQT